MYARKKVFKITMYFIIFPFLSVKSQEGKISNQWWTLGPNRLAIPSSQQKESMPHICKSNRIDSSWIRQESVYFIILSFHWTSFVCVFMYVPSLPFKLQGQSLKLSQITKSLQTFLTLKQLSESSWVTLNVLTDFIELLHSEFYGPLVQDNWCLKQVSNASFFPY